MSNIKISDLQTVGLDLFSDSESYIRELSDTELVIQGGGILTWVGSAVTSAISAIGNAVQWIADNVDCDVTMGGVECRVTLKG